MGIEVKTKRMRMVRVLMNLAGLLGAGMVISGMYLAATMPFAGQPIDSPMVILALGLLLGGAALLGIWHSYGPTSLYPHVKNVDRQREEPSS